MTTRHYIQNTYKQLKAIPIRYPVFYGFFAKQGSKWQQYLVVIPTTRQLSHVLRWRTNENQASNSTTYARSSIFFPIVVECKVYICILSLSFMLFLTFSLFLVSISYTLLYRHSSHPRDDAFTHRSLTSRGMLRMNSGCFTLA